MPTTPPDRIDLCAPQPVRSVVAFGSNLGDSVATIRWAMDRLEAHSISPLRRSSLWTSTPVDCPPGSPIFVNAVAILSPRPDETPESLLAVLQALEVEAGRRPKVVLNESRPLDLDLISWADQTRCSSFLTLPHPRAQERRFVLEPLAELEPGWVFPGTSQTVRALLGALPEDAALRVVAPPHTPGHGAPTARD